MSAAQVASTVIIAPLGAVSIAGAPLVHRLIPSGRRQPGQEETVAGSAAAAQTGGRIGPGAIFGGGLARITLPAMLVSIVNLAGYWGAAFWIPTFLTQERGLSVEAMLGFTFVMYAGMFFGFQFFGLLADRVGRRRAMLAAFWARITPNCFPRTCGPMPGAFAGTWGALAPWPRPTPLA